MKTMSIFNLFCFVILFAVQTQAFDNFRVDKLCGRLVNEKDVDAITNLDAFTIADSIVVDNFSTERISMIQIKCFIDTTTSYDLHEIQRRDLPDTTWNHITYLPSQLSSYLDTTVIRSKSYQYQCRVHTPNGWERSFISIPIFVDAPCVIDMLEYLLPPKNYAIQYRLFSKSERLGIPQFDTSDVVIKFLETIDTSSVERVHFIREVLMRAGRTNDTSLLRLTERKDSTHTFSFSLHNFWGRNWAYLMFIDNPNLDIPLSVRSRFNRIDQTIAQTPPKRLTLISIDIFIDGGVTFERDFGIISDGFMYDFGPGYSQVSSVLQSLTSIDERIIKTEKWLIENYPNPFSERTTITLIPYSPLPKSGEGLGERVSLKIYDLLGREVLDLSDRIIDNPPSAEKLTIENSQLRNPGVYFYRLTTPTLTQTKAMVYVR